MIGPYYKHNVAKATTSCDGSDIPYWRERATSAGEAYDPGGSAASSSDACALRSTVTSITRQPWSRTRSAFVTGNPAASPRTSSRDLTPVCRVARGKPPVRTYVRKRPASLYIRTPWNVYAIRAAPVDFAL